MSFDIHSLQATSLIVTAPSPAMSGTSLTVTASTGTIFGSLQNAVVCPPGVQPTLTNSEVIRITNISTDTFTITRAQEGSSAISIGVGYQIFNAVTPKVLTDIETIVTTGNANTVNSIAANATPTANELYPLNANAAYPTSIIDQTTASSWNTYTPVITGSSTNPNIGSTGTIAGRYKQIGKNVNFEIVITVGGSGISAGSGNYSITIPVAAYTGFINSLAQPLIGRANIYSQSSLQNFLTDVVLTGSTTVVVAFGTLSTLTTGGVYSLGLLGTSTISVANSNVFTIAGSYEAA